MKLMKHHEAGQSLIEMIVVIGVVILLITGIIAGTSTSLARTQNNQIRSAALQFAQEGIELARQQRDAGWNAFAALGSTADIPPLSQASLYCVGSDFVLVASSTPCASFNINSRYIRSITFTLANPSNPVTAYMSVDVTVSWGDPSILTNKVELKTRLTQWK